MKALCQYEHTTKQQFQAVRSSISVVEAFVYELVPPKSEVKEEKVQDGKPDKEALVGEIQKALPGSSRTLKNC